MTLPKQVLPGTIYLVTRRCTQRQFLLRPSLLINQLFAYCLAMAMSHSGVELFAFCVISNHYHLVVRDPEGRLSEFLGYLNMFVSKCVNASLGRWENVWASEPPSAVALTSDEDVIEKMIYTLANPVSAGLVARGKEWPGLRSSGVQWIQPPCTVVRPAVFFRPDGVMPEQVELKLSRPPILEQMSDAELAVEFERQVLAREQAERRAHLRKGGKFLGRKKILSQSPYGRPRTRAPRRGLNPRVAGRDKWRRIEALQRLKQFWIDYRDAFLQWKAGKWDVVFPAGTYALRVHAGVACSSQ